MVGALENILVVKHDRGTPHLWMAVLSTARFENQVVRNIFWDPSATLSGVLYDW
jgi:hypothetical protein